MRKKIIFITLSAIAVFMLSCENKIALSPNLDDFMVITENHNVKVGDSVKFKFMGKPDLISFYSGEVLHQYEFREGRIVNAIGTVLSFRSAVLNLGQNNQLSVLISTDYKDQGNGYSDISSSHWIDVTNRFIYGTSGNYVFAGEKDISDVVTPNNPFYIGFRYTNKISEGAPRRWFIQSLVVKSKTESIGDLEISAPNSFGGYKLVEQYNDSATSSSMSSLSATTIILAGDPATTHDSAETWAISTPYISGELDFGPDHPIGIKGFDSDIDDFSYIYTKPGIYNVVFIAKNVNIDQEKEVVRNIQIVVEE